MDEIIKVEQADMLAAINRSEVDMQITTAKQYPRDIQQALNRIQTLATLDEETAGDCFYTLRRGNGGQVIEGLSVRFAEIIAGAWGNLRAQARIIGNDGRTITAQGVCHDLETNFAVSVEVKRRITDRNGKTFNEDMQVMTGNAACAIAFRNAVLKVVPKSVTKRIVEQVKQVAIGQAMDLETSRSKMIAYFGKIGVNQSALFAYLGVKRIEDVDAQMIFELRGLANALKEGTTTIAETFQSASTDSQKTAEEARKKAEEAMGRVNQATAQGKGKKAQECAGNKPVEGQAEEVIAEEIDPETGEVIKETATTKK